MMKNNKNTTKDSTANELWSTSWTYIRTVIDTAREPFLILDRDLRIIAVNSCFLRTFEVSDKNTEGRLVYDLGNGQWNIPRLKNLLEDILPCLEYRNYKYFYNSASQKYEGGVRFCTQDTGKEIINYPKLHLENGENKNAQHRTDQKYKHLVRILKNAKRQLVEKHGFDSKIAPSYFIESIVYNVPDNHFGTDYRTSLNNILEFILRKCAPAQMTTVSHQHLLFGLEPWQWNTEHAATFFQAVENL